MPAKIIPIDATWVKQRALNLGFSMVGITTPDPPQHHETYRRWIGQNRHADMSYLAREDAIAKRSNPRLIVPDCQSIIVTGTSYAVTPNMVGLDSPEFQVAMYALGSDYHQVLVERLTTLINAIEEQLGEPIVHRIYTDTGPVLERELGQRSGLGWIGKNTCLIHPQQGSYFLLAEVLLALPLDPDPPFTADRCGACTRCIAACPTRCIMPDRTLDAGRCISYLTIENKGHIPRDLRSAVGDWLFGCDICQQVCPWNQRFLKISDDEAFKPRPFLRESKLSDFIRLSPSTWRKPLRNSPLERPRRKGLVRNAAVVAGNQGMVDRIDDLISVLREDPEPVARSHAAWALGQIEDDRARQGLITHLEIEKDAEVINEITLSVQQPNHPSPD